MATDPNEIYFEYKLIRLVVLGVISALGIAFGASQISHYIEKKYPPPVGSLAGVDVETAKAVEYIRQGYVERKCGQCEPGWFKREDNLHCRIDNLECPGFK